MRRGTIIIDPDRITVTLSSDGTVRMTVEEIASIFHVTATSVERRIAKLLAEGELDERKVRTKQNIIRSGKQYIVEYYNLNAIIALCFRINTPPSKAFRRWITKQVVQSLRTKTTVQIILQIGSRIGGS